VRNKYKERQKEKKGKWKRWRGSSRNRVAERKTKNKEREIKCVSTFLPRKHILRKATVCLCGFLEEDCPQPGIHLRKL
jgi:hypothetical protein